jgi:hypothetical protein
MFLSGVAVIKDITAFRTELGRILRVSGLPTALIASVKRCVGRLLTTTFRAELTFVYCTAGAGPAFSLLRLW